MLMTSTTETYFWLLNYYNMAIDIIELEKHSKFYNRRSELFVKYKIGLKTLLQQGISEPIFLHRCLSV